MSSARIFGNIMQSDIAIVSYLVTRTEFLIRLRTQTMLGWRCGTTLSNSTQHSLSTQTGV